MEHRLTDLSSMMRVGGSIGDRSCHGIDACRLSTREFELSVFASFYQR